jgi:hypothetical protein
MKYLVVWSDEGDVIQSEVELGILDPWQMTNNDWVTQAAKSESYTEEEIAPLLDRGYSLFLVCDMPERFFA